MSNSNNTRKLPEVRDLEETIMNFFEDVMYEIRGGSPLFGRIFGLCVLAGPEETVLQKDLAKRFKVSTSAISRNLKTLEDWGLLDRRRQPGSGREWEYRKKDTAFLDLFTNQFETNAQSLGDRKEELIRLKESWNESLSPESKESDEGARALHTLNFLIEWIDIIENELTDLNNNLTEKFWKLIKDMGNPGEH